MCLAIPMKVLRIEDDFAIVEATGLKKQISIQLLKDAKVGDYLIVHAGFAIQKLDTKEARETLDILKEIK
jgi:hydrogenase expression/formation protein HypC